MERAAHLISACGPTKLERTVLSGHKVKTLWHQLSVLKLECIAVCFTPEASENKTCELCKKGNHKTLARDEKAFVFF